MRCFRQENKYVFKCQKISYWHFKHCFLLQRFIWWLWLACVDCASPGPQVDDPLRPAQWIGGRRSGRSNNAEILSFWRHRQRRQPHGVHWKTYVHVTSLCSPNCCKRLLVTLKLFWSKAWIKCKKPALTRVLRPTPAPILRLVTLTFDFFDRKINGFPVLIVEHLYVKFGDPICVDFWDIVRKIRRANNGRNLTCFYNFRFYRLLSFCIMFRNDLCCFLAY